MEKEKKLIGNILNDFPGTNSSSSRKLKNGLPRGSAFASPLVSMYIADMPDRTYKNFGYANDKVLGSSCN